MIINANSISILLEDRNKLISIQNLHTNLKNILDPFKIVQFYILRNSKQKEIVIYVRTALPIMLSKKDECFSQINGDTPLDVDRVDPKTAFYNFCYYFEKSDLLCCDSFKQVRDTNLLKFKSDFFSREIEWAKNKELRDAQAGETDFFFGYKNFNVYSKSRIQEELQKIKKMFEEKLENFLIVRTLLIYDDEEKWLGVCVKTKKGPLLEDLKNFNLETANLTNFYRMSHLRAHNKERFYTHRPSEDFHFLLNNKYNKWD